MKKVIISLSVLLLLLLIGGMMTGFSFLKKPYEIRITQAEIKKQLEKQFPLEKTHLLFFKLTYSNPELELLPGVNRVRVGLDTTFNLNIQKQSDVIKGGLTATGKIRYDQERQTFHLDQMELERVSIAGVPEKWEKKVKGVSEEVVQTYLKYFPVYELKDRSMKERVAKAVFKGLIIEDKEVIISLGL